MTEIKMIMSDDKMCRIVDNHTLKEGKSYNTLFTGSADECIEFLKQKGIIIWR